jgi:hypothetical protein
MTFVLIAVLTFGAYSAGHLLWAIFTWEIRWEMRLIRLAVHSALFGAAAVLLALLWSGWVRI